MRLGWHIMRDGDGTVLYFGRHQGAPFAGVDLRGFTGWRSYPRWMPGGWEFYSPTLHIGRLFMDRSRWWSVSVLVPAGMVRLWRMRDPTWRRLMREEPIQERRPCN